MSPGTSLRSLQSLRTQRAQEIGVQTVRARGPHTALHTGDLAFWFLLLLYWGVLNHLLLTDTPALLGHPECFLESLEHRTT